MVRGCAAAILGPALFTDQRHERDGAKILFLEFGLALARELDQGLITLFITDRNDPVGLVCIAVARKDGKPRHVEMRYGSIGRETVQARAMADALAALIDLLETS